MGALPPIYDSGGGDGIVEQGSGGSSVKAQLTLSQSDEDVTVYRTIGNRVI